MSSSGDNYGGGWSSDPWGQGGGQDQWGQGQGQGGEQQGWGQPTQDWGAGQQGGGQAPQPTQGWGGEQGGGQAPQPGQPGQGWGGPPSQPGQPGQGWGEQQQWGPPPGQPGQPGQPPGGGWGGQPQWGGPPGGPPYQGGPPKKSNKGLIIALVAGGGGVVVIVVVALILVFTLGGGGGGTGGGGGGGGSASGKRTASWNVPEPDSKDEATLLRSYVVDNMLVRASGDGLTAYDIKNGKVKWNLAVPDGSTICAAAPDAPNKIAAIVFGSDDHCTTIAAVNIDTGKQAWSSTPKTNSDIDPSEAGVAAGGGKIYVSNEAQVFAFSAESGKQAWAIHPKNEYCHTGDIAASDKGVLLTLECSLDDKYSVIKLNPKSGDEIWTSQIQSDEDFPQPLIMNVSPPVIHIDNASDNGELRILNDQGKQTHVVSSRGEGGDLALRPSVGGSYDDLHRGFPVQIVGTTLVALVDKGSDTEAKSKAVGVDLTTGKRSWVKNLQSSNDFILVDGSDGANKVQVIDTGDYDTNPQLNSLDLKKRGAVTEGDTFVTPDSVSYLSSYGSQFISASGTLLQMKNSESGDEPIVIAYR